MIALVAKLNVRKGAESEFEATMLKLAEAVRQNETGNQLYMLVKDSVGQYAVLELYDDATALEAHGQSDHFKAAGASFAHVMAGAPDIERFEVIG